MPTRHSDTDTPAVAAAAVAEISAPPAGRKLIVTAAQASFTSGHQGTFIIETGTGGGIRQMWAVDGNSFDLDRELEGDPGQPVRLRTSVPAAGIQARANLAAEESA